ncbi:MAG: hypothetical protein ACRCU0_05245 [Candidatus Rhabdochlamydia sp.]
MSIQSNIIDSINSRVKFLDFIRYGKPYRFPIFFVTNLIGVRAGKEIARYVRDHNFNHFSHSDRAIIRNAYRIYNYLFPADSARKYFMEVALPDNFSSALIMEVHLHTMPYPIERPGGNIEETILTVTRICLFIYCLDKVRRVIYKILSHIPHRMTWPYAVAVAVAPTGIYSIAVSNEENVEFRN